MSGLAIVGAGGHAKVVAEVARLNGLEPVAFYVDDPSADSFDEAPLRSLASWSAEESPLFVVAIGNARARARIQPELESRGGQAAVLVHPSAVVSGKAALGDGTVVAAGAVVNPYATVGRGCIVNTCASVDHDCAVGDWSHVSVGCHVAGGVTVGDSAWLGIGSCVSNGLSICSGVTLGAGAVVVRDIDEPGTYVGVPARRM